MFFGNGNLSGFTTRASRHRNAHRPEQEVSMGRKLCFFNTVSELKLRMDPIFASPFSVLYVPF